jgi:hypothetical protein
MEKWNPLELISMNASNDIKELAIHSTRQQIRNILKSYVGYYDPFCELLQNAMDAVDKREELVKEESYTKKINIIIDLKENSVYVSDNGIGFDEVQFKTFLSPNISFKISGKSRGNKGVGTTYIAYGFNRTEIFTKTNNYLNYAFIEGGRKWIDDIDNSNEMPYVQTIDSIDSKFTYDRGTSFKIYFSNNEGEKIKDLLWLAIDTAEAWKYVLLTNTPLGHLDMDSNKSSIKFDLTIIRSNGTTSCLSNEDAVYYYPHKFLSNNSIDLETVIKWQKEEIDKGKNGKNTPQRFNRKLALYRFFDMSNVLALAARSKRFEDQEIDLINDYKICAYGFFCNSVDRWKDINEKIIKTRKGVSAVTFGLQMATDNMIQGNSIQIPLTSNIGQQKQSQIIVHFNGAEPDLGRKGFQPELKVIAEKIAAMIVSLGLSTWKELLAADGHYELRDSKAKSLHDYIREMESHEVTNPLKIISESFFLPTKEISITSIPKSEQDVVVLFNQLLAGGVIRSIELMASSTYAQYDGLYKIRIKAPLENHFYDKKNNPLGIEKERPIEPGIMTAPACLEYKYSFDALLQDFDNEDKDPRDIGLVIVWTMGNRWRERFQTISYLLPDYRDRRPYHGITHEVFDGASNNRAFYVVVLEELVDFLNNADQYIDDYKDIYDEYQ